MIERIGRLLVVASVAIAASMSVHSAVHAADSPVAERAYQEIQDCVSRLGAQLNVLYVVDESGSLDTTDPENVRAAVLAQSLNQLGRISQNRTVYTAISTFAVGYTQQRPWTELSPREARSEAEWALAALPGLNQGTATNWLAALEGAASTMDSSPDAESACKVVVWMTDGAIAMPDGTIDTAAALEQICAADPFDGQAIGGISPVVAQLRTNNINLIGVLLRAGSNDPYDLAMMTYMKPIVEGEGTVDLDGATDGPAPDPFTLRCGQVPIPENQAAGALIEATDPLDLAFKFAAISIRIAGGSEGNVSPGPPVSFAIDEGVGSFSVLIEGSDWTLEGPDGSLTITEQTQTDDVTVEAAGGLRTVEVQGASVAPGTWTVSGEVGQVQLFLYSGLQLTRTASEVFSNEPADLTFSVLRQGSPVADLKAFQPTTLDVTVSQPGAAEQTLTCTQDGGSASFTCPYTPDQVGDVTVIARLPLTTRGGLVLEPVPFEDTLRVRPPADYPQVQEPDSASGLHEFTPLVGRRGVAQGTFTLQAPAKGDGEICFPAASDVKISIDPQPGRIADFVFTGLPDSCVALPQGTTSTVSMQVANPVSANGNVEGFLVVTLKSSERAQEATQEVAFTFASERKADPPLLVLAGLGLVGLLVPIGLLYLQSAMAARLDLR